MELSIWRRISPEKLEGSCLSGGKTLSKFLGKNREQLPSWGENPDWISVKNWNGFSQLGGKPGLDFCQKLEWILLVGWKTRTGFLSKTGMESSGWRENTDQISAKTGWILLVGGKTRTGFLSKTGMDSPGWRENPDFCQKLEFLVGGKNTDWISVKNWNGFSWLEGKPGPDFWQKLEWILLVGGKTWTGLPLENWNGVSRLDGKPGLDFPQKTGMESPSWWENSITPWLESTFPWCAVLQGQAVLAAIRALLLYISHLITASSRYAHGLAWAPPLRAVHGSLNPHSFPQALWIPRGFRSTAASPRPAVETRLWYLKHLLP
ncbi:hypothetical protein DUI87_34611 [Hirundo rustica rustica]|uniref:Uncharacterized protein n=1 Tax=Hirundo rustica rustica TaxID=333673 RepID=A0A3M0ILV7_HIRRU|nr:hypothetical protein DUI87_34611 [Hirundo rustica rustica]